MGTATSWIAIQGASLEEIERELDVVPVRGDAGKIAHGDIACEAAVLAGGWVLVVEPMKRNGNVADARRLARLSRNRRLVACDEESHVMYSGASEWRDGSEVWAVVHASEEASDDLEVRGTPIDGWERIRDELVAAQAQDGEVDYIYEIPLVIAQRVVGFRTGEDGLDAEFVALTRRGQRASGKPWWKFW
ncbi:MAG TPA: hypothetical protein VI356_08160 [Myxococcales bacterium]